MTSKLVMGNEAMAYAALEAGVAVVCGYPGTPSSELTETVARLHNIGCAHGVHVEWSTNEKAALEVAAGASLAGARALMTCKQMGLNVASDALMSLNYLGVLGGLVIYAADDPGPISSQTEQDTRRFAAFAKVPVLDPSTPEQGFAMMKEAFELSERFGTPVIVRPTTRICHASTFIEVADETFAKPLLHGGFERNPRWIIFPPRAFAAHREINERLAAMSDLFSSEKPWVSFNPQSLALHPASMQEKPQLGIITGGVSTTYAFEALERLQRAGEAQGLAMPAISKLQIGTSYPFPAQRASHWAQNLERILVFEELDYVIEDELLKLAGKTHASWKVEGKLTGAAPDRGENSVALALEAIARFIDDASQGPWTALAQSLIGQGQSAPQQGAPQQDTTQQGAPQQGASQKAPQNTAVSLPPRPPVLCAGCPHRASFLAVKQALGDQKAVLCGDIGCYTLGNAQPLDAIDTCLCMGAGITMAEGFNTVEPDIKAIAFVGDSTYFASGLTGIANATYNRHDITIIVLDNATTAMTGAQPHPGTGVRLMGGKSTPLSIKGTLQALGVESVTCVNPFEFEEAVSAARDAIAFDGPSAVVFQAPCIQLTTPGTPMIVDPERCIGCRRCTDVLGCPAITFDNRFSGPKSGNRGQAEVIQELCNGCGLCTHICPAHAFVPATCTNEEQ